MKRMAAAIMLTALLWSCSSDKGTDPGGGGTPVVWNPLDSISFAGYSTIPRLALVDGNMLYVSGDGGFLACIDISNPDSLKLLGYHASVGMGGEYPNSMAKRNNYLVCSFNAGYEHPDTLEIFDVSNPASPQSIAILESEPIPLSSGYISFGTCIFAGDTLMVQAGVLRFYRMGSDGSLTFLDDFSGSDIGGCPYAGLWSVWLESDFWYFSGVCIDTEHHPQLWVAERGTMNVVARSAMTAGFAAGYQGIVSNRKACFFDPATSTISEVSYTDHNNPSIVRTVSVPAGFNFPDGIIPDPTYAHWYHFVPVQAGFVAVAQEGIFLLNAEYRHVRNYFHDRGEWYASGKGNRVYEIGGGGVNVFAIP